MTEITTHNIDQKPTSRQKIEVSEIDAENIEVKEIYIEKTIKEKGLQGKKGTDGKTPTDAQISALIKPLVPKVKDGKTPTKKELKELIKEVFPEDKLIQKVISKMPKEEIDSIEIGEDKGGQWISKNGKKMYIKGQFNIGAGMSTGVYDFIKLRDTPDSYVGQAGKFAKVKSDETGLEFAPGDGTGTVTQVDTDSTLTGGPITTTGTLGLNLSNENDWQVNQTFTGGLTASGITADSVSANVFFGDGTDITNVVHPGDDLSVLSGVLGVSQGGTGVTLLADIGVSEFSNDAGYLTSSTGVTSVTGTASRITSSGGTTPVIDISASYVGQTSITTLGTIGTGTWNATTIGVSKGGTGLTTFGGVNTILYTTAAGALASTTNFVYNAGMLQIVGGAPSWTTAGATKSIEIPNNSSIKWAANGSGFRWGVSQFTGGVHWQQNSADSSATALYRQIWRDTGAFEYYGTGAQYSSSTDVNQFASLMTVSGRGTSTSSPFLFLTHLDDNDSAKNLGIGMRCRANSKYMAFGMTGGQWDNSFGSGAQGYQVYYGLQFTSRSFSTAEAPTVLAGWRWQYFNGSAHVEIMSTNILSGTPALQVTKTTEQLRVRYDSSNYFNATVSSSGGVTFNAVGSGSAFTFSDGVTFSLTTTTTGRATFSSGENHKLRVVTAAGAVTVATTDYIVVINKTVGAATAANLPATPTAGDTYIIKDGKGDANANNITVTPAAGNIDGAGTYVMNVNYQSVTVVYNGTEWNLI